MNSLLLDIRYSARKLLRTPGFTLVVITTLALAIGATTAVFSIVNGVLLKPLPFADPDRIVFVASSNPRRTFASMSYLDFRDYGTQSRGIAAMAAIDVGTHNLTAPGTNPARLRGARVSANFFDLLGIRMVAGRGLAAGDDAAGAPRTAVLSEGIWRSRFGADRGIVGQAISLDGNPVTVIGVAPAAIPYPRNIEIWLPLIPTADDVDPLNRGAHYLAGVGRLGPRAIVEGAREELVQIARRLAEQFPQTNAEFTANVVPLRDYLVHDARRALYVLLGCVAFVLLIACANVANLLLVRAVSREAEISLRAALGASVVRVLRQLVTEGVLLSIGGAVGGVALAVWAVGAVRAFGPADVPRLTEVTIDGRALAVAALVSVATGVLFGLVPVRHLARANIAEMLGGGARGSSGPRDTQRTRSALVVSEMALAVVLLISAGLLTRSLVRLTQVDSGFRPENVVTMSVSLPAAKYPWDRQQRAFAKAVVERMRTLPGTQNAAVVFGRPLDENGMHIIFERDDRPPSPPGKPMVADVRAATAGFFATMGIRVKSGRTFEERDRSGSPPVLVVSEAFVRKYYPGEEALGKMITLGYTRDTSAANQNVKAGGEIVGVVADVKQEGPAAEAPATVYLAFEQVPISVMSVVVRSTADPRLVLSSAQSAIKAIDPDLPVFDAKTMEAAMSDSIAQPRFYTWLFGAFAGIALLLAVLGIYGVISYSVSQRTRELGIRMALGASRTQVMRLVLGQGFSLTVAGTAAGILAAAALTRVMASMLFGVTALDALTFGAVSAMLIVAATVAAYVPARRASTVDPTIAMRRE